MKNEGVLLKTDGNEQQVYSADQKRGFTLDELYKLIGNGCDIVQVINLRHGGTMWLDEEGKLRRPMAPVNPKATILLREAGGMDDDMVVGNVILFLPKKRSKAGGAQ